ncbi:hypothetical protein T09_7122 [Trichinella sp. T9]|nr:hypothetical protein T09_7122 [Trichinella sp. T9]
MPGVELVQARLRTQKANAPSQRYCIIVSSIVTPCDIETMLTRRVCRRVNSENKCRGGLFLIVS